MDLLYTKTLYCIKKFIKINYLINHLTLKIEEIKKEP